MAEVSLIPSPIGPPSEGSRFTFRQPEVSKELERVRNILTLAGEFTGTAEFDSRSLDFESAEIALTAAEKSVAESLRRFELQEPSHGRLVAVLTELHQARVFLRDAALARRGAAIVSVQESLQRLRGVSSIEALVERVPAEVSQLGVAFDEVVDSAGGVTMGGSSSQGV